MNLVFWKDVMLQDCFWVIALSEHTENRLLRKPASLYDRIPTSISEAFDQF
jgi:hypothetical protein